MVVQGFPRSLGLPLAHRGRLLLVLLARSFQAAASLPGQHWDSGRRLGLGPKTLLVSRHVMAAVLRPFRILQRRLASGRRSWRKEPKRYARSMTAEKREERHDDEAFGRHEPRRARTRELLCGTAEDTGRSNGQGWPWCRKWGLCCCPSSHKSWKRTFEQVRGDRGVLDGRWEDSFATVGLTGNKVLLDQEQRIKGGKGRESVI